nr:carbohydrate-binding domain-containing protein [Thermus composti]
MGALGVSLLALSRALSPRPLEGEGCLPGPLPERAELWSNGAIALPLCREATLVLDLEGTPAQGQGPHAVVVEGSRVLWEGEVLGRMTVRVRVTGKGTVALAFTNDLYQPPKDRNLFLRGLRVEPP